MDKDDLLKPDQPKVVAQMVIQILELPNGQMNHAVQASGEKCDEILVRYMLDKARATLDDHFRMQLAAHQAQQAPRVMLGNGALLKGIPRLN